MVTYYANLGENRHEAKGAGRVKPLRRMNQQKRNANIGLAKFIFLLAVMLFCFAFGAIVNAYASGAADASAANEHTVAENPVITVKQGDTIWAIAKRYAADGTDIRKIVWQIKRVNHLETGIIHAGDRLLIPGSVVEQ